MQAYKKISIVVLALFYSVFQAQTPPGLKTKRTEYLSDNKKITALDSVVENAVIDFIQSPQNCGLSIGIIKDTLISFYNYGETKRDNKVLPKQNSLYETGSITKTFCGILLAYAVNEGKIKLDDDIRKYLPGEYPNLKTAKNVIEIKHLANHSSGLPRVPSDIESQDKYDPLNPYKNYNKEMLFDYLKKIKLENEPGQICDYSNTGMALLGIILERVYKRSFEELVKEKICYPNNMNNTAVNLSPYQLQQLCDGHDNTGNIIPHWDLGAFEAAGGIKSCTNDMINYLKLNMVEKDAAIKLSHMSTIDKDSNVGLAWHIIKTKYNNELVWHNGGTFGFSSFCGFIKEKKIAIIILSNTASNVDFIGLSVLKFLQK